MALKFKTVKAVRLELQRRGGYLETISRCCTKLPEYVPHLSMTEQGWIHGAWTKAELMEWASEHLTHS